VHFSAAVFDTGEKEIPFGNDNSDLFAGGASVTKVTNHVVWCVSNRTIHYTFRPQGVQVEAKQSSLLIHCSVMMMTMILIG